VNTWKAILAVLVIFGAGLVTGHVATRMSESAKPAVAPNTLRTATHSSQPPLSLEQLRKVELMGRVQKDLDLTPEQHARIEKIIEDSQGRIRDLWDQVAPDIHDEYDDVQKKLCQELTPEQKKTFDDLMKQQQHFKKPAGTNAPSQPHALRGDEDKCPDMCSLPARPPAS
jgi:Spy/CpxP family protein refolding chaperone